MKAQCKNCGEWFPLTRELEELIIEGIISPVEVNLCQLCAEDEAEMAEWEASIKECIF